MFALPACFLLHYAAACAAFFVGMSCKRMRSGVETSAAVFRNDRSGFQKRPQSFWKTSAVVFGKEGLRFAKGKLYILTENALQRLMDKGIAHDFAIPFAFSTIAKFS